MATSAAQIAKTGKYGDLRRRLVFLLLALVVYRVGAHIPVPGINAAALGGPAEIAEDLRAAAQSGQRIGDRREYSALARRCG